MKTNQIERSYDAETGNQLSFQRIRHLGHDWIYTTATLRKHLITSDDAASLFNVVHAPDCPCVLEGVRVTVFGYHPVTEEDASMLRTFRDDYNATFVGDEAEDWDEIVRRVMWDSELYPAVHTFIAVLTDRGIPAGALVAEHYAESNVLLITYAFMRRKLRRAGRGYAVRLVREGVAEIRRRTSVPFNEARVFFEGENPDRMTPAEIAAAPFDPRGRIGWFRSLAARRLSFECVQPPLASGKRPVSWLDMYTLDGEPVSSRVLIAFLTEFYDTLGVNVAEADKEAYYGSLKKMVDELRQKAIVPEEDF